MNAAGQLSGKIAVVIGAASTGNIGQTIARRFIAEGCSVMVAGRNEAILSSFAGSIGGSFQTCDITLGADLDRLVDRTLEKFGRLDIAVNCTGRNHNKAFLDTTREELDELTAVQFIGPFLFMQAVVRGMRRLGTGGSIIQISSVTSTMLLHDHALYMGTKAGIDHVVRAVAYDHGKDQIRVNSISPGPTTDGPMAAAAFSDPVLVEKLRRTFPLGRIGSAADLAAAAVWLARDDCFVTGQLLQINGGQTLFGFSPNA